MYGCVRFSLTRNFFVVLCQQLGEEDEEEKNERKKGRRTKRRRNTRRRRRRRIIIRWSYLRWQRYSVYDSLLRFDISHNRHVLGKRGRERERERKKNRDDTQKNGSEWNEQEEEEKTSKKGQRLWKKPTITENKEGGGESEREKMKKGIIPPYSPSTWTLYETRIPGNNVRHVYFQI